MGVVLHGSCHCKRVQYSVESETIHPYMICHCQADTKTAGFYNINIMGISKTLQIKGTDPTAKKVYQAVVEGKVSSHERHFCGFCGSFLYAFDERYGENVYPFASSIDEPQLPMVPEKEQVHIMAEFKQPLVQIPAASQVYQGYPSLGIRDWHEAKGKLSK